MNALLPIAVRLEGVLLLSPTTNEGMQQCVVGN